MSNKNNELNFLSFEEGKETTQKIYQQIFQFQLDLLMLCKKIFKRIIKLNKLHTKICLLFNSSRIFRKSSLSERIFQHYFF